MGALRSRAIARAAPGCGGQARHDNADVLTAFIDEIIPVLQAAKPVKCQAGKGDRRTKRAVQIKEMRGREGQGSAANGV